MHHDGVCRLYAIGTLLSQPIDWAMNTLLGTFIAWLVGRLSDPQFFCLSLGHSTWTIERDGINYCLLDSWPTSTKRAINWLEQQIHCLSQWWIVIRQLSSQLANQLKDRQSDWFISRWRDHLITSSTDWSNEQCDWLVCSSNEWTHQSIVPNQLLLIKGAMTVDHCLLDRRHQSNCSFSRMNCNLFDGHLTRWFMNNQSISQSQLQCNQLIKQVIGSQIACLVRSSERSVDWLSKKSLQMMMTWQLNPSTVEGRGVGGHVLAQLIKRAHDPSTAWTTTGCSSW